MIQVFQPVYVQHRLYGLSIRPQFSLAGAKPPGASLLQQNPSPLFARVLFQPTGPGAKEPAKTGPISYRPGGPGERLANPRPPLQTWQRLTRSSSRFFPTTLLREIISIFNFRDAHPGRGKTPMSIKPPTGPHPELHPVSEPPFPL